MNNDNSKKDVIPLDYGVMLLKNWLDENEQMALYCLCIEIAKTKNQNLAATLNKDQTHQTPLFFHNWPGMSEGKIILD